MQNAQAYKNKENYFTTDFNLSHRINKILSDQNLSAQADRLLIRLINASGAKGFCFPSIKTICSWVKRRPTQVRQYLRELEFKRYIRIFEHEGHSNEYQIVDILPNIKRPLRFSEHRKEILNQRKRYTDANVIDFSLAKPQDKQPEVMPTPPTTAPQTTETVTPKPPERPDVKQPYTDSRPDNPPAPRHRTKPIRFDLVKKILDITKDHKSFGLWVKFVRSAPIETVFMAIHSLEVALSCDQVSSPGRYMVGIIRNVYPELFKVKEPVSSRPDNPPAPRKDPEPTIEQDYDLNREKIREILTLLGNRQAPPTTCRTNRTFGTKANINKKATVIDSGTFSIVGRINAY